MTTNEKLDIVEALLKERCHYKGNRTADYSGPYFDYVRNPGSIDVFSENDLAFYWAGEVVEITSALRLTQYLNYDSEKMKVFSHIYG